MTKTIRIHCTIIDIKLDSEKGRVLLSGSISPRKIINLEVEDLSIYENCYLDSEEGEKAREKAYDYIASAYDAYKATL